MEEENKQKFIVKFFGQCRTLVGAAETEIEVKSPITVKEILQEICTQNQSLSSIASHILIAVNESYAMEDQLIQPNDDIAIFPPVSGG